jgi:hypothetical protein
MSSNEQPEVLVEEPQPESQAEPQPEPVEAVPEVVPEVVAEVVEGSENESHEGARKKVVIVGLGMVGISFM